MATLRVPLFALIYNFDDKMENAVHSGVLEATRVSKFRKWGIQKGNGKVKGYS